MGKPSPPFILYLVGVFALVNSAQSHSATWQSTGRESFSHILESFNVTSAWRAVLEDDALCRTPSARVTVNQSAKEAELTLWCPPDDYQPQPPTHSNSSHYALNLTGLQLSLCVIEFFTDKDFVVSLPSDVFAPAFSFTLVRLELIDNQALAGSLDGVLGRIFRNYPNLQKLILTGNGFLGKVTDAMAEKLAQLEKFTLEP